jgi:hypothetical protein
MPTSDEDLQAQADKVQKMREQVADAEANRQTRELELSNDIAMTQLKAEEAQLSARLTVAKNQGKVSSVKAGADAPLSAAKAQLEASVAAQKAAEKDPETAAPTAVVPTPAPAADTEEGKK